MIQLARADHVPLYILFVDLRKAYDGIDRTLLCQALVRELGVAPALVVTLQRMYTDVSA